MTHKYKVSLTFREFQPNATKGRTDQEGYVEQYRDEWTFDIEEDGDAFMNAIMKATELVKLLWKSK